MMKIRASLVAITVAAAGVVVPAGSASADGIGGWIEEEGDVVYHQDPLLGTAPGTDGARSAPRHTGSAQTRVVNGTSQKRAVGRTTWNGVYHYTTARLEHTWPSSGVIATSGRVWGVHSTSATSPWRSFNPKADSNGYGIARTYYGR